MPTGPRAPKEPTLIPRDDESLGRRVGLRVAHVAAGFYPALVYGGPTESVYQLCVHLVREGCRVRVLTTNGNGPGATLDVDTSREVLVPPDLPVRYRRRWAGLAMAPGILASLPAYVRWAEVVHLTSVYSFTTFPTLLCCRAFGKPLVWSPRGSLQRWSGSTRPTAKALWEKACFLFAPARTVLHTTSESEERSVRSRFPGVAVRTIPNGVAVPDAASVGSASDAIRIVYLGRLHPIKGIDSLLEACAILRGRSVRRWSLTLAGAGEASYERELARTAGELGLDGTATFVGHVAGEEKERLLRSADVLVLPSHSENFGMVVAEALAHGVPVVASLGTPWADLERVGCGLHVENSPESLANAMEKMLTLPLREMGARGRAWMLESFAWPAIARRMSELYHEVAGLRATS